VLVHASLRRVGQVEGGKGAVLSALKEAIGVDGTLVVPTFTSWNSATSRAYARYTHGMSPSEKSAYLANMPAFDAETTRSMECGWLTEQVRSHPGAVRSRHPQSSFAAFGPAAEWLMSDHDPSDHLGEKSPLAKLYESRAQILMIGVGFEKCTAFHLAEYRYIPSPPRIAYTCKITEAGGPEWWSYQDVVLDDRDFAACGQDMKRDVPVAEGLVGRAESRCFPLTDAVDFAESWLRGNRCHVMASREPVS
jgi:aminoglycoside 3-N-acetyltransferase